MRKSKLNKFSEKIIYMYTEQKQKISEIADFFDVEKTTIRRYLKKNGIEIRKEKRVSKLNDHKEEIIGLYENNISIEEIGKRFECSKSAVHNFLKRNKVKPRKIQNSKYSAYKDEIIKMYMNKNIKIPDICEKFNIHNSTFFNLLKRYGISTNRNISFVEKKTDQIVSSYISGKTIYDITKETGFSYTSVRKTLLNNDIKLRSVGRRYGVKSS